MGDARQVHMVRWSRYLIDTGFDVITASLEPMADIPGKLERIRIPDVLPDFLRYPMAVPAVRGIIRRFKPHLVNAHFAPNYGVIAAMSGFQPWVLSTWGSDIMLLPQRSAFHKTRTRYVIKSAASITSDASVMSERLVALGADPERVITFPFGVDRRVFYPARKQSDSVAPPSSSGGLSSPSGSSDSGSRGSRGPRVLSNRKIEAVYNIDTIISAWDEVTRPTPSARLTIAGTGSLLNSLQSTVKRSNSAPAIDFVGEIPHDDMPDLLRDHDIFLSIASSDTTSVSLLEAMACGLFPIVSDIPANREWIRHSENGLLVPPRNSQALSRAIADAWGDHKLRKSAEKENAHLIETRADWFENMSAVKNNFDRLIDPAKAPS
jgi:glycosyltransferase involved in cell wall biosynthesis